MRHSPPVTAAFGPNFLGLQLVERTRSTLTFRMDDRRQRERRVREGIVFADPLGHMLEAFHGAEVASDPFRPGRSVSGFRTGSLGMGHIVMNVERVDQLLPFYTDVLGFGISDYTRRPFTAYSCTSIRDGRRSRVGSPAGSASVRAVHRRGHP